MKKISNQANGQMLVLVALMFFVVMGFLSLAIDGGMIMAERRRAQSAADAAAVAGVGKAADFLKTNNIIVCTNGLKTAVRGESVKYAGKNGYLIQSTDDTAAKNGVTYTCTENTSIDVKVMITSTPQSFFNSIFKFAPIKNTVTAAARLTQGGSSSGGSYALVALNNDPSDNGILGTGSIDITITNGGMFSNSGIRTTGSGDIETDKANYFMTSYTHPGSGTFDPLPTKGTTFFVAPTVPDPNPACNALPSKGSYKLTGSSNEEIFPGRYSKIDMSGSGDLKMNPGLYCLSGDFDISGSGDITADGITIVMLSGDIDLSGSGKITMKASPTGTNGTIPGLLFYMPPILNPSGDIKLTGSSKTVFQGTILAPKADLTLDGSGGNLGVQVIVWNIELSGSGHMTINYDGSSFYSSSAASFLLELSQ